MLRLSKAFSISGRGAAHASQDRRFGNYPVSTREYYYQAYKHWHTSPVPLPQDWSCDWKEWNNGPWVDHMIGELKYYGIRTPVEPLAFRNAAVVERMLFFSDGQYYLYIMAEESEGLRRFEVIGLATATALRKKRKRRNSSVLRVRQVTSCGETCQKAYWKRHKTECREHLALKKTIKNFESDKPNTTNIPILSTDLTGTPVTYDGIRFL
ncbi:hypothetical protein C8R44DRAFT_878745 [Mycena epipterygia]|nr:hypothetical protein C8R44DRAFT_878745 [Mycena epipterygia]